MHVSRPERHGFVGPRIGESWPSAMPNYESLYETRATIKQ